MKINFEFDGQQYECSTASGTSLAIPMDFAGSQPNFYGTEKANCSPLNLGEFVGDTSQGGSCNVDRIELIPHCNGTHTETIGHIVNQDIFIGHDDTGGLSTATLITVHPESAEAASDRGETYRPALNGEDQVLSRAALVTAFETVERSTGLRSMTTSLIVRTSNELSPMLKTYDENNRPAFLTVQAMELLVERGYQHLLVDLPSVDRMNDEGLLTNHHLFWKVKEGTHELAKDSCQTKTISEMIFVPDSVEDGFYLLNNQFPAFCSDAAPSRPIIFKPTKIGG